MGCSVQREFTLISIFYLHLGLSQGHWVSHLPTLVKYVGSRQKSILVLHVKTMQ